MINEDHIIKKRIVNKILFDSLVTKEELEFLKNFINDLVSDRPNLVSKRVRLVFTEDKYTNLKPGDCGTVTHVDDSGTVFVDWDNGSGLGLIPGIDKFELV